MICGCKKRCNNKNVILIGAARLKSKSAMVVSGPQCAWSNGSGEASVIVMTGLTNVEACFWNTRVIKRLARWSIDRV